MTAIMENIANQTRQTRDLRRRRRVPEDWARPTGPRPVRVTDYREHGGVGVSRASHPLTEPMVDRLTAPQLIAAGLFSATVVAALFGVAHWRAGDPPSTPSPTPVVSHDIGFADEAR